MQILIPALVAFATLMMPTGATSNSVNAIAEEPSHTQIIEKAPVHKIYEVSVSAYSSSVDETDSTPNVTASGTRTHDGVMAANFLPIGTRVQLPDLYGDKIFIVEDRMHRRFSDSVDVWMPSKAAAMHFGRKTSRIVVLD